MMPTYIKVKHLIFSARSRLNKTMLKDLEEMTPVVLLHEHKEQIRDLKLVIYLSLFAGFCIGLSISVIWN